jgi:hypothetical protein
MEFLFKKEIWYTWELMNRGQSGNQGKGPFTVGSLYQRTGEGTADQGESVRV